MFLNTSQHSQEQDQINQLRDTKKTKTNQPSMNMSIKTKRQEKVSIGLVCSLVITKVCSGYKLSHCQIAFYVKLRTLVPLETQCLNDVFSGYALWHIIHPGSTERKWAKWLTISVSFPD